MQVAKRPHGFANTETQERQLCVQFLTGSVLLGDHLPVLIYLLQFRFVLQANWCVCFLIKNVLWLLMKLHMALRHKEPFHWLLGDGSRLNARRPVFQIMPPLYR